MSKIDFNFFAYIQYDNFYDCFILKSYSNFKSWLDDLFNHIEYHINNYRSIWFDVYLNDKYIDTIYILKGGNLC